MAPGGNGTMPTCSRIPARNKVLTDNRGRRMVADVPEE